MQITPTLTVGLWSVLLAIGGFILPLLLTAWQWWRNEQALRLGRTKTRNEVESIFAVQNVLDEPSILLFSMIQVAIVGLAIGVLIDSILSVVT